MLFCTPVLLFSSGSWMGQREAWSFCMHARTGERAVRTLVESGADAWREVWPQHALRVVVLSWSDGEL